MFQQKNDQQTPAPTAQATATQLLPAAETRLAIPKSTTPIQRQVSNPQNGLPSPPKSDFESLSGYSADDARVDYNSSNPAQLSAYGHTPGTNLYFPSRIPAIQLHSTIDVVQRRPTYDNSWDRGWYNPKSWSALGGQSTAPNEQSEQEQITKLWGRLNNLLTKRKGKLKLENGGSGAVQIIAELVQQYDRELGYPERAEVIKELDKGRAFIESEPSKWGGFLGSIRDLLVRQAPRELKEFTAQGTPGTIKSRILVVTQSVDAAYRSYFIISLRGLIDNLPIYVPDFVVNTAHKALNKEDVSIGMPDFAHIGPSQQEHGGHDHIINRGITEGVLIEGAYYTPIYMAVFGNALGTNSSDVVNHKDVGQDDRGRIRIHTGSGKVGEEASLWISIGRPLRQVKWLEKYEAQGAHEPLIRSFLVPTEVANEMAGDVITEHQASGSGKNMNVDKHYERNQYGIVDPASLEQLREFALPGSLRTYAKQRPAAPLSSWGDTRTANEMRERLGIPPRIPGIEVFVNHTDKEFTKQGDYQGQADQLSRVYAYFTNNSLFLPVDASGQREVMPADHDAKAQQFYQAHLPPDNPTIGVFMEKYVAPWATQASVAKFISDDYENLSNAEKDDLPRDAPEVRFQSSDKPRRRGLRNQANVALAQENRALLSKRFAVMRTDSLISAAFPNLPFGDAVRGELGRLRNELKPALTNYGFTSGNYETVERLLGDVRTSLQQFLPQVQAARLRLAADDNATAALDPIINAIGEALA